MASAVTPHAVREGSVVYAYAVATVAAAAGLLFGFDIAVINGAIIFLRAAFSLTEVQTEFAASSLLIGCVVGASIAGYLSDRYGRKPILMLSAVLFGLSALGAALPRNVTEFVVARFAGGIAIGVASVLAPLYIAEISPPRIRGRLVSLNQMAIVTGILLAYLVSWSLAHLGQDGWRWMFAAAAVPSVAFLIGLFFVPESPRWLTEFGRGAEAERILTRVAGAERAAIEMAEIREAVAEEAGTMSELLEPGLRRALIVAVSLAVLQQVTGINTVLFYGSIIFREQVGSASEASALAANVIVGAVNFAATIVALWLIDKAGRKPLLIISSAGMGLAQLLMGVAFMMDPRPAVPLLLLILGCVAAFAIGLGPGVWVVISEIFPNRIRGRAMSIATISLWAACVLLTMTFLTLVRLLGISGAFWLYAGFCFFTALFVWRWTPETKGKTLEQIEALWKHRL